MNFDLDLNDFPRMATETDDSPRIQRAIDAASGGILYIPKGEYEIASPLKITGFTSIELHACAWLKAIKEMEFVLSFDGRNQTRSPQNIKTKHMLNMFIRGGVIDGNGLSSGLSITGIRHFTLSDMTIANGKKCGLYTNDGCELIGNNLYVHCDMPGLRGNIGMLLNMGDSHWYDCIVVDYTIGVEIGGGSNRLDRVHVWGGPVKSPDDENISEYLVDSVNFHVPYVAGYHDVILRDCYADTGATGFLIEDCTRMYGCTYFNNYDVFTTVDDPLVIDHRDGYLYCDGIQVSSTSPRGRFYKGDNQKTHWGEIYLKGPELKSCKFELPTNTFDKTKE